MRSGQMIGGSDSQEPGESSAQPAQILKALARAADSVSGGGSLTRTDAACESIVGSHLQVICLAAAPRRLPERADPLPPGWLWSLPSCSRILTRTEPSVAAKFEVYKDKSGEYRWRLKSANGQVIATGGEGYENKSGAENGIAAVKRDAPGAPVEDA